MQINSQQLCSTLTSERYFHSNKLLTDLSENITFLQSKQLQTALARVSFTVFFLWSEFCFQKSTRCLTFIQLQSEVFIQTNQDNSVSWSWTGDVNIIRCSLEDQQTRCIMKRWYSVSEQSCCVANLINFFGCQFGWERNPLRRQPNAQTQSGISSNTNGEKFSCCMGSTPESGFTFTNYSPFSASTIYPLCPWDLTPPLHLVWAQYGTKRNWWYCNTYRYSTKMYCIKKDSDKSLTTHGVTISEFEVPLLTSPEAGSTAFSRSDTAPARVRAALIRSLPPPTSSSISAANSFTPFDISVRLEEMVVMAQPTAV